MVSIAKNRLAKIGVLRLDAAAESRTRSGQIARPFAAPALDGVRRNTAPPGVLALAKPTRGAVVVGFVAAGVARGFLVLEWPGIERDLVGQAAPRKANLITGLFSPSSENSLLRMLSSKF
jgi:hypothetical protein